MTMRWWPTRHSLPWWLLIVSLAFNLGFSTTYGVRTYGPIVGPGPHREQRPHRSRWQEPLNLTAAQWQEMRRINESMFSEVDQYRSEVEEARQALADLVAADEPDRDAIAAQLDLISSMQRQLKLLVVESLLEQKKVLRPDQVAIFNQTIREKLFPPRGGPGRGGPGPAGRGGGRSGRGGRGPDGRGPGGGPGGPPPDGGPGRGP
jgi:Spy/CpxP family protein refolding chaperone